MDDERIAALERELNALYYSISHDLRAPLRAVDGFSQAVLEDYGAQLDAEGRRYLERVCAAARKMTAMIDGLLEISRLNREPLNPKPIDLAVLAGERIEELRQLEPERKVRWVCAGAATVTADPKLARIALTALLDNAWKFTRRNDDAEIAFELTGGVVTVRDNGAGFDPALAGRLFSPFQRLHPPEEFEGTGLGLARAARVVARHGGRIWSEAVPGKGASFHFTLGPPPDTGESHAGS